jgi:GntR family transcriptional regulator/MocR family aminotransferase
VSYVEVFIDPDDGRSLVEQVYARVRSAIVEGRLAAGDMLTPTRTLAGQLGLSRFTVTEAYGRLVAEGIVEGRRSQGTFVTSDIESPSSAERVSSAMRPRAVVAEMRSFADPARTKPPRFDLRAGRPDLALFPLRAWRRCTTTALQTTPPNYGDPVGDHELRTVLAHWIGRTRGVVSTPADVVVTSGALHGLDLTARAMLEPGEIVAVEEPGYPPAVHQLRISGYSVVGVPVDENGLIVDAIPNDARLVYVTPSHQFPLGAVLSHRRRLSLLRWARANNAAIVEDDYDSHLRYASRPLEPLQRLDTDGRVVYLGTMSKVFSPSLRLGFVVAPRGIVPALAAVRYAVDWCPPWPNQAATARFIADGHLDRHIARAPRRYRARRDRIVRRLADAPIPVRPLRASAGLHIAVHVDADDSPDDAALANASAAEDLVVGSLRRCYSFGQPPGGLLLGFGSVPDDQVDEVMGAIDRMLVRLGDRRRTPMR